MEDRICNRSFSRVPAAKFQMRMSLEEMHRGWKANKIGNVGSK